MQGNTEKIVKQIIKGDQAAFKALIEKYQQYAFSLAFRILCDEDEAKDAVQESFIKIWKSIKKYDQKMKFSTWIYKIVTNSAIDRLRSIKRIGMESMDDATQNSGSNLNYNPDKEYDNRELAKLIRTISGELPEKQKLVFVMRDIQGMSSIEVENILDIPADTVKSNLYHARKVVKEKLNKILHFDLTLKNGNHGM